MGKTEKQAAKFFRDESSEQEEEESYGGKASKPVVLSSSDDEEANADLSLQIVQKALLMRTTKLAHQNDAVPPEVVVVEAAESESSKKTKKVRTRSKRRKVEVPSVIDAKEEVKVEADRAVDIAVAEELNNVQISEITNNVVLRKLLRGPRYFDPPDKNWGTCFNCGEEGHAAVNCTVAKRKKPCYICGSLEHNAKQCEKGQDCFICKRGQHQAKNCPEKYNRGSLDSKICLKCGDSGHEMYSCKSDYPSDDLKEIQCYVCKTFGHLCCVKYVDFTPTEVSCYKCGQLGHTGMACIGLRDGETTVSGTPRKCYKCNEGGHIARECTSSSYACIGLRNGETTVSGTTRKCYKCNEGGHIARECTSSSNACIGLRNGEITVSGTPRKCYKCNEGGHIARECTSSSNSGKRHGEFYLSTPPTLRPHEEKRGYMEFNSAPHDLSKVHKRKHTQNEERGFATPQRAKHRGGWLVDDPEDFSTRKGNNSWKSPATPYSRAHRNSGGHESSSRASRKLWNVSGGSPITQGSSKSKHKYFEPKFNNSSADGFERYNHW